MSSVLLNTFIYIFIIFVGYFLKRIHILKKSDSDTLALIITTLTLPAMLLSSSNGLSVTATLLWTVVISFVINFIMIAVAKCISRKETPLMRGVTILSTAGIDVGNFVLPFIKTFFPGEGVIALCTFNIGNTIMNTGGNYAAAIRASQTGTKVRVRDIVKKLLTSVTFDVYLLIIVMSIFQFSLPDNVMAVVDVIGNANIFLIMLMIGLKLEFRFSGTEKALFFRIILSRLLLGLGFSIVVWMLPLPLVVRIVMIAAFFGPPATIANAYSRFLGYKGSLTSQIQVVCIFIAMVIITGLMIFFT